MGQQERKVVQKASSIKCTLIYFVKIWNLKYCILNVDTSVGSWSKETCKMEDFH